MRVGPRQHDEWQGGLGRSLVRTLACIHAATDTVKLLLFADLKHCLGCSAHSAPMRQHEPVPPFAENSGREATLAPPLWLSLVILISTTFHARTSWRAQRTRPPPRRSVGSPLCCCCRRSYRYLSRSLFTHCYQSFFPITSRTRSPYHPNQQFRRFKRVSGSPCWPLLEQSWLFLV